MVAAMLSCSQSVKNANMADETRKQTNVEGKGSPEAALRLYLWARTVGDAEVLKEVLLQQEYLERMVRGGPVGEEQSAMTWQNVSMYEFRSLKVGHKLNLAGGRTFELTESHVNENRRQLAIGNDPFPFDMVRIDGKWKVNIEVGPGEPPPEQVPEPKPQKPSAPKPDAPSKT